MGLSFLFVVLCVASSLPTTGHTGQAKRKRSDALARALLAARHHPHVTLASACWDKPGVGGVALVFLPFACLPAHGGCVRCALCRNCAKKKQTLVFGGNRPTPSQTELIKGAGNGSFFSFERRERD